MNTDQENKIRAYSCPLAVAICGFACCVCLALFALGGCKPSSSVAPIKPSPPPVSKQTIGPKLDACTLLTKEEIQAVQGSALTDTKPSEGAGGAFRVAQCYFATAESNRSI